VPHLVEVGPIARRYVAAKGARMGHVVDARFAAGVPAGTHFRPAIVEPLFAK
jgi:hypothetical protein